MKLKVDVIGERPTGETPSDSPLVELAVETSRMLGFEPRGPLREDVRVGTPALLLGLCLEYAQSEIARLGGDPSLAARARSLYPYAFAPREEFLIERRLRALG